MSNNFRFIDLFAGIGGIRIPFEELGGECVFSSEWDKFSQITYEANFGERPKGDITKINAEDIPSIHSWSSIKMYIFLRSFLYFFCRFFH